MRENPEAKMTLTSEQLAMVGVITESRLLIAQAEEDEKGEFDMCTALEHLMVEDPLQ